jgi:hypothetical protein
MLEREIVLPALVWRDAGGDFRGVANDTISLRVPAYVVARTRALRGGRPITIDELTETKVDVTLDTDVYKAVSITDEDLTLDIVDFGAQVLTPCVHAVARGCEDALATTIGGATYEHEVAYDPDDPFLAILAARRKLNDSFVPAGGRALACGSGFEESLLGSDRLLRFDSTGDSANAALREAVIGRVGGFTAVSVPALDPDEAVAFHSTAFVLSMQSPVVPDGVTWGESQSFAGLSMRVIKDYDFLNVQDRLLADVFVGSSVVMDRGTIGGDGKFVPSVDGTDDPILVRAVNLTPAP